MTAEPSAVSPPRTITLSDGGVWTYHADKKTHKWQCKENFFFAPFLSPFSTPVENLMYAELSASDHRKIAKVMDGSDTSNCVAELRELATEIGAWKFTPARWSNRLVDIADVLDGAAPSAGAGTPTPDQCPDCLRLLGYDLTLCEKHKNSVRAGAGQPATATTDAEVRAEGSVRHDCNDTRRTNDAEGGLQR